MIKGRIVYVDEDPDHIVYFCDFADGYFEVETIQVENGNQLAEIVDEILNAPPDAIITDFMLNEMAVVGFDGQALIEAVQERNRHIPCFLLTSHAPDALNATHDARLVQSKSIPFGSEDDLKSIFRSQIAKLVESYRKNYDAAVGELQALCSLPATQLSADDRQRLNELDDLVESYGLSSHVVARELKEERSLELLSKLVEDVGELIKAYEKNDH